MIDLLLTGVRDPRKEPLERLPLLVDGPELRLGLGGVDAILQEDVQRDVIQRSLVRPREVHLGLLARLDRLSISRRAEAPLVAGHDARKHPPARTSDRISPRHRRDVVPLVVPAR